MVLPPLPHDGFYSLLLLPEKSNRQS